MSLFAPERHQAIRKLVRQHRRMSFAELEKQVKVSPATLRRDLAELEQAGDIIRVHGGVLDAGYARVEASFEERVVRHGAAKKMIAEAAAAFVGPGSTVLIDAGSTCLELGKLLLGRKDVRIITHSAALLEASFHGEAPVVCLGGELRRVSGALTGASALGVLAQIRADIAFLAASGLDAHEGCSTTELSEAEMKRAFLTRADRKILLADHSKWNKPSTVRFAEWGAFNDWVTDQPPAPAEMKTLRQAGVKTHRA